MINYTVGIEGKMDIKNDFFAALTLGGGVSQRDYEVVWRDDIPSGYDNESTSISTFSLFFMAQLGVGKDFGNNTSGQIFVRYNKLSGDKRLTVTPGPDGEAYAVFNPMRSFVSLGVSLQG